MAKKTEKPVQRVKRAGKKTKKYAWIKWVVLAVVVLLIAAGAGYAANFIDLFNRSHSGDLDKDDLGISSNSEALQDDGSTDIVNIALFGVDTRTQGEKTRSDSIMILSVDKKHNKIKLTSLMRDTYVAIEGHSNTKLTHAYYYGGPQLAVKTINQNFGTNITEYATVNFQGMAEIIDAVGGVEIDISEAERQNANHSIEEQAAYGMEPDYIEKAGLQTLSGTQAVAYARIRHVGNADFERTDRQRKVMEQLFNKALDMNPMQYPEFARKLLPYVETSLDIGEIMGLSTIMLRDVSMEQLRIPMNEHLIGSGSIRDSSGGSCLNVDLEAATKTIQEFIYDDVNPNAPKESSTESSKKAS